MLPRNIVLLFSVFVLLVEGDLDSNDAQIHTTSTDKDSTSDEVPTESMNAISPDQPDESQYYGGGPSDASSSSSEATDTSVTNHITAPEPAAAAAAKSVEEEDEDENSDSDEVGKKKFNSRLAKPQSPALNHPSAAHVIESPALPPQPIIPQPIIPQPKSLMRSRTSKRRSRTNRRQM